MEWNCFILTSLFSVCYKFENMLKVSIYLNCALDSKFGHCSGIKVLLSCKFTNCKTEIKLTITIPIIYIFVCLNKAAIALD